MSGGVDSSVSAVLLKKQGYDVIGAFIVNWSDTKNLKGECAWKEERRDAMRVAAKLDIPLYTFNFEKEYRKWVVEHMFQEYKNGRTPNPDILCNKFIKFGLFVRAAKKLKADFIATGHYARVKKQGKSFHLLKGRDKNKDQSYFLYTLDRKVLSKTLFPVGCMLKSEVRAHAEKNNLSVLKKPESMGVCFIGKINLEDFLKQKIKPRAGDIVTVQGERIGRHNGIFYYTVGQRHGFGIKGGGAYYVAKKDVKTNQLIVALDKNNPALYEKQIFVKNPHWINKIKLPISCQAKIRHRQPDQACRIASSEKKGQISVVFTKPQWAVAPGQSVVFYKGDQVLGGGVIESVIARP